MARRRDRFSSDTKRGSANSNDSRSSFSRDWFEQMAVIELPPGTDAAATQRALYDSFKVELPINDWNGRTLMRIAVQGYNTQSDLDRLVEGLSTLLPQSV